MRRVLVVSPHPDDESIGCGGTLLAHAALGDLTRVVFVTSGEAGIKDTPPERARAIREAEAEDACRLLGVASWAFWRQPDGALAATPQLVDIVRDEIRASAAEIVYVPHAAEDHPDHRACHELVAKAVAELTSDQRPVVYAMEIWTPLQRMQHIVDISPYLEAKLDAIRAHRSQCATLRFDEAARGLARYRGEMHSWPGGDYAEVFAILK